MNIDKAEDNRTHNTERQDNDDNVDLLSDDVISERPGTEFKRIKRYKT